MRIEVKVSLWNRNKMTTIITKLSLQFKAINVFYPTTHRSISTFYKTHAHKTLDPFTYVRILPIYFIDVIL